MKKILVPTDFSATARCALAYAQYLAAEMEDVHIDVVHLYLPATAAEYPNIVPPIAEFLEAREKMLHEFVEETKKSCEGSIAVALPVKANLLIGFPADEIVRLSPTYDLIVMGTTGESDILDNMFGSVSSHVARKSKCPVILVPKGVEFKPLEQILYASNYESADSNVIHALMDFNQLFNAKLHFIHVRNAQEAVPFNKTKEEIFSELFSKGEPEFAFEIEEIEGEDVTESINTFAVDKSIDLVVMVARKRSFWDSFFHRSQTRRMALNTKMPLMVFHVE
jgi:nucleotide-binding universal stress UspA family protein